MDKLCIMFGTDIKMHIARDSFTFFYLYNYVQIM
jgi:hypothetical protein